MAPGDIFSPIRKNTSDLFFPRMKARLFSHRENDFAGLSAIRESSKRLLTLFFRETPRLKIRKMTLMFRGRRVWGSTGNARRCSVPLTVGRIRSGVTISLSGDGGARSSDLGGGGGTASWRVGVGAHLFPHR